MSTSSPINISPPPASTAIRAPQISRRWAIQILGFAGGGIGAILLGKDLFQAPSKALEPGSDRGPSTETKALATNPWSLSLGNPEPVAEPSTVTALDSMASMDTEALTPYSSSLPSENPESVADPSTVAAKEPTTFISKVIVDLWKQEVTLEWTGPNSKSQETGPYHCAPGAGLASVDCDDETTSRKMGTKCTPKGDFPVISHDRRFGDYPEAEWVTRFQSASRGIALHYYPDVPEYPVSNGCIRIADKAVAKRITEKTTPNISVVSVHGLLRPKHVILQRGDISSDVRKIQMQLKEKGYALDINGDFDSNTEATIKQFQQDKGLSVDGIFGPATFKALFT
ncbi:MAG: peptidoglycan-binding protein [Leptolyngbyaceae cyanobacterium MO_188.B28]|nr:peptidoglycan-binding protein [Leptolyngbyaceae cyanobacterium MO_188.B28]